MELVLRPYQGGAAVIESHFSWQEKLWLRLASALVPVTLWLSRPIPGLWLHQSEWWLVHIASPAWTWSEICSERKYKKEL